MAVKNQVITDRYAIYNGDCIDMMQSLPDDSVNMSIYSPPFVGLYHYSSNPRDLSNAESREDFLEHYSFVVEQIQRVTMPGRMSLVHVAEVPDSNVGKDNYFDFPGEVIRLHQKMGWRYIGRRVIWKEPLWVRLRTLQKSLQHQAVVEDACCAGVASADHLLVFANKGDNQIPVTYPTGFDYYAGESPMPDDVLKFKNHTGKQTENKYSQWIWRQYASSVWDDIRMENVLPFRDSKDPEDERHVHPLQLDVIERGVQLYTNPNETVLTPFLGVGSEAYAAVKLGRKAIGAELKPSYFNQAIKNMSVAANPKLEQPIKQSSLDLEFDF
jgi:hypothetical protein